MTQRAASPVPEQLADLVAESARLAKDPTLTGEANRLWSVADAELRARRTQLDDTTALRSVEDAVGKQLAALALLDRARAAAWKAEALRESADAIRVKHRRGAQRDTNRAKANDLQKRIEELEADPAEQALRDLLVGFRDMYAAMADPEFEKHSGAVSKALIGSIRTVGSQARTDARRLQRRRVWANVATYGRRLLSGLVLFLVVAFGIDRVVAGALDLGGGFIVVAVAVWWLARQAEAWAENAQTAAERRWLLQFLDRVAWARWYTEFGLLVDERLRHQLTTRRADQDSR